MAIQYNEFYHERTGLTVGVQRVLFSQQSKYQLVEVLETETWGNLLTIDGMVMCSERDEFVYHEMLSHVPLMTHPNPQRVLIVGGGDGGTAREVLKYPTVIHVDLVEIDQAVVDASRQFLPDVGNFDHPNLNVIHADGAEFVKANKEYDVILIDGSDPVGPAKALFQQEFYKNCFQALQEDGVLAAQTESPWIDRYQMSIRSTYRSLKDLFRVAELYLCSIPLYPAGLWSMMIASKSRHPLDEKVLVRVDEIIRKIDGLHYYNRDIHRGAFALPEFVKRIL